MTSSKHKTAAGTNRAAQTRPSFGGTDVVVLTAMAAASIAIGVAMHLQAGMGMIASGLTGGGVFAMLAMIHTLRRRIEILQTATVPVGRDRHEPSLHDVSPANAALDIASSQLAAAAAALRDRDVEPVARKSSQKRMAQSALAAPVTDFGDGPQLKMDTDHGWSEPGDVDALVRQYAEELDRGRTVAEPELPALARAPVPRPNLSQAAPMVSPQPQVSAPQTDPLMADAIRAAAAGQLEIHLQPIVSFADRKARLYEVFPRIIDAKGTVLSLNDYQLKAETMGLELAVERAALLRCCAIQRNLSERGRARSMIFRLSPAALRDRSFLQRVLTEIKPDPLLADLIVFEIDQSEIEQGDGVDRDNMELLGRAGFRFSLGSADTLALELEELTARRIGFVRVTATVLNAEQNPMAVSDLRNGGIETILTDVVAEGEVSLGLAFGLVLGQGRLFSEPKPLRSDVAKPAAKTRAA